MVIRTIGNKEELLQQKQERTEWENLLNNIANMNSAELTTWFNNHFSGLSQNVRAGLEMIVRVLWANTKVTKKLLTMI